MSIKPVKTAFLPVKSGQTLPHKMGVSAGDYGFLKAPDRGDKTATGGLF
jgi:hypothetical protein